MDLVRLHNLDANPFCGPTSGRKYGFRDAQLWLDLEQNGSFGWSQIEVEFNSGFTCHVYLQGRNDLSDYPPLLRRVALTLCGKTVTLPNTHGPQKCLIGIPTAGTQLAQEICSVTRGRLDIDPYCFRTMRSVLKAHGKDQQWIGNANLARHSYVTVENVLSTGKAMLTYLERMEPEGYPIRDMDHVVFASWELGGIMNLAKAGITNVYVMYSIPEVIALFVELKHWPAERLDYIGQKLINWKSQ
jgi:orotate phosphoribosyltransferase